MIKLNFQDSEKKTDRETQLCSMLCTLENPIQGKITLRCVQFAKHKVPKSVINRPKFYLNFLQFQQVIIEKWHQNSRHQRKWYPRNHNNSKISQSQPMFDKVTSMLQEVRKIFLGNFRFTIIHVSRI